MRSNDIFCNKISEIRKALKLELYNCALALALTLPDVCGKVEFPNAGVSKRYKEWFDKYAQSYFVSMATVLPGEQLEKYTWLTSSECY